MTGTKTLQEKINRIMQRYQRVQRRWSKVGATQWEAEYIGEVAIAGALGLIEASPLPETPRAWHLYEKREAKDAAKALNLAIRRVIDELKRIMEHPRGAEVIRRKLWKAL